MNETEIMKVELDDEIVSVDKSCSHGLLINGDWRCVKLPDESVDLIVTDPPYRITSRGSYGGTGGMLKTKTSMDGKIFKDNDISPKEYASEFYRILKDGTHCYVMCNHINLVKMITTFTKAGFKFTKSLIWDKGNKIVNPYYMSSFEYILFFRKGRAKRINNCGTADILRVINKKHKGEGGKNLHDTEKPVELMKILIENSSNPNDVVLDPFMGIGSTGVAAKDTDRMFIGCEINNSYYNIARNRIVPKESKIIQKGGQMNETEK